jgi:hypothetical protein
MAGEPMKPATNWFSQALMQFLDLGAHRHAQLGVEVGERLVEQEHLWVAHDGAPHRDALALSARQLPGIALQQRGQRQDFGGALDAIGDLVRLGTAQLERKAHIVGDRHMRIERVVLEHHCNVALFGLDIVDDAVADRNRARGDIFQAREHAQQGRLAAAGGTDQHDELAVLDRNRHAVQDLEIAERFSHVANLDRRHPLPSLRFPGGVRRAPLPFPLLFLSVPRLAQSARTVIVRSLSGFGNCSISNPLVALSTEVCLLTFL